MNNELTELVLIVDKSGSMGWGGASQEAEVGINDLIEKQKQETGQCKLTLVEFNDVITTKHDGVSLDSMEPYFMSPNGGTALFDAVGTTIDKVGERLADTPEAERPGLVVVVIVTDGGENSSKEYTGDQVAEKVTTQRDTYNWQFTFLGAGEEAFAGGAAIGIDLSSSGLYDTAKTQIMYRCVSENISNMRSAALSGSAVYSSFTDEQRAEMR